MIITCPLGPNLGLEVKEERKMLCTRSLNVCTVNLTKKYGLGVFLDVNFLYYGTSGVAWNWFQGYLLNRRQLTYTIRYFDFPEM